MARITLFWTNASEYERLLSAANAIFSRLVSQAFFQTQAGEQVQDLERCGEASLVSAHHITPLPWPSPPSSLPTPHPPSAAPTSNKPFIEQAQLIDNATIWLQMSEPILSVSGHLDGAHFQVVLSSGAALLQGWNYSATNVAEQQAAVLPRRFRRMLAHEAQLAITSAVLQLTYSLPPNDAGQAIYVGAVADTISNVAGSLMTSDLVFVGQVSGLPNVRGLIKPTGTQSDVGPAAMLGVAVVTLLLFVMARNRRVPSNMKSVKSTEQAFPRQQRITSTPLGPDTPTSFEHPLPPAHQWDERMDEDDLASSSLGDSVEDLPSISPTPPPAACDLTPDWISSPSQIQKLPSPPAIVSPPKDSVATVCWNQLKLAPLTSQPRKLPQPQPTPRRLAPILRGVWGARILSQKASQPVPRRLAPALRGVAIVESLARRRAEPPPPEPIQPQTPDTPERPKLLPMSPTLPEDVVAQVRDAEEDVARLFKFVLLDIQRRLIVILQPINFHGSKHEGGVDIFIEQPLADHICRDVAGAFFLLNERLHRAGKEPFLLKVEGHTSWSWKGHEESIRISTLRARKCRRTILRHLSVLAGPYHEQLWNVPRSELIYYCGCGATRPIPEFDDGQNHPENRRVEMCLVAPGEVDYRRTPAPLPLEACKMHSENIHNASAQVSCVRNAYAGVTRARRTIAMRQMTARPRVAPRRRAPELGHFAGGTDCGTPAMDYSEKQAIHADDHRLQLMGNWQALSGAKPTRRAPVHPGCLPGSNQRDWNGAQQNSLWPGHGPRVGSSGNDPTRFLGQDDTFRQHLANLMASKPARVRHETSSAASQHDISCIRPRACANNVTRTNRIGSISSTQTPKPSLWGVNEDVAGSADRLQESCIHRGFSSETARKGTAQVRSAYKSHQVIHQYSPQKMRHSHQQPPNRASTTRGDAEGTSQLSSTRSLPPRLHASLNQLNGPVTVAPAEAASAHVEFKESGAARALHRETVATSPSTRLQEGADEAQNDTVVHQAATHLHSKSVWWKPRECGVARKRTLPCGRGIADTITASKVGNAKRATSPAACLNTSSRPNRSTARVKTAIKELSSHQRVLAHSQVASPTWQATDTQGVTAFRPRSSGTTGRPVVVCKSALASGWDGGGGISVMPLALIAGPTRASMPSCEPATLQCNSTTTAAIMEPQQRSLLTRLTYLKLSARRFSLKAACKVLPPSVMCNARGGHHAAEEQAAVAEAAALRLTVSAAAEAANEVTATRTYQHTVSQRAAASGGLFEAINRNDLKRYLPYHESALLPGFDGGGGISVQPPELLPPASSPPVPPGSLPPQLMSPTPSSIQPERATTARWTGKDRGNVKHKARQRVTSVAATARNDDMKGLSPKNESKLCLGIDGGGGVSIEPMELLPAPPTSRSSFLSCGVANSTSSSLPTCSRFRLVRMLLRSKKIELRNEVHQQTSEVSKCQQDGSEEGGGHSTEDDIIVGRLHQIIATPPGLLDVTKATDIILRAQERNLEAALLDQAVAHVDSAK